MKLIKDKHRGVADFLAFSLIPLAGFATDVYLPSFPTMAISLHASPSQIQFSLLIFMVSGGISQLFVGSFLDSFGRYKISNIALFVFSIASLLIGLFPNLLVLYIMRVVQGVSTATVLVAKRAHFMDIYSGHRLKHYTSLFSIIWATAPIIAPFVGAYLQHLFGWQANFYFLSIMTFAILILTLIYGGETNKNFHAFKPKALLNVYREILSKRDFDMALLISGVSYGMVLLFGMASPFMIEHLWHLPPMITGYCALLSGVSLMVGGIISKSMINKAHEKKIPGVLYAQIVTAALSLIVGEFNAASLGTVLALMIIQHLIVGFVFNNFYAYSLARFSRNAGIVSGMTGATLYTISSFSSYGMVNLLGVKSPIALSAAYLLLNFGVIVLYSLFRRQENKAVNRVSYGLS